MKAEVRSPRVRAVPVMLIGRPKHLQDSYIPKHPLARYYGIYAQIILVSPWPCVREGGAGSALKVIYWSQLANGCALNNEYSSRTRSEVMLQVDQRVQNPTLGFISWIPLSAL